MVAGRPRNRGTGLPRNPRGQRVERDDRAAQIEVRGDRGDERHLDGPWTLVLAVPRFVTWKVGAMVSPGCMFGGTSSAVDLQLRQGQRHDPDGDRRADRVPDLTPLTDTVLSRT